MANFWDRFEVISADFDARGVPTGRPGFYDDPTFIAAEKSNPALLFNYAGFVAGRPYSAEYLRRARREVPFIAELFFHEVKRMGRVGACVDASMILSRIMEREGIWNVCVKGALHILASRSSGGDSQSFWAFDNNSIGTGHAWLFAPPFEIVDTTVRLQPYANGFAALVPDTILSEDAPKTGVTVEELISPELRRRLVAHRIPHAAMLPAVDRNASRFTTVFSSHQVRRGETEFRYHVTGMTAGDAPLEKVTNMQFGSRSPVEMYTQVIQPELASFRAK